MDEKMDVGMKYQYRFLVVHPDGFEDALEEYANAGYRVVGGFHYDNFGNCSALLECAVGRAG